LAAKPNKKGNDKKRPKNEDEEEDEQRSSVKAAVPLPNLSTYEVSMNRSIDYLENEFTKLRSSLGHF
jgi:hypothetical protein